MAAGLAEAGAGHRQELAVMWGRFLLVGCVWGRFLLVFCVCPKGNPRGGASRVWGWGDPRAQGSECVGEGRDSSVPSHICCPRTLLSGWKRCW